VGYAVVRVTIWARFMALWIAKDGGWKGEQAFSFVAVSLSGASVCFQVRKDSGIALSFQPVSAVSSGILERRIYTHLSQFLQYNMHNM